MADEDLSRKPHDVKTDGPGRAWFYEERGGIDVIHEILDSGQRYIRTDHIRLSWRQVRAALKRKDL